jgi:hypothetical protein
MMQGKDFQPQMHADGGEVDRLSERIVGCAFQVVKAIGLRRCLLLDFGRSRLESPAHRPRSLTRLGAICIANLANHRSPRLFSDALPVTRCFA